MSDIPTFDLPDFNVTTAGDRVVVTMAYNHDVYTLLLSASTACALRDDLISACQQLGDVPPLTVTQQHNSDGSISVRYGWQRGRAHDFGCG